MRSKSPIQTMAVSYVCDYIKSDTTESYVMIRLKVVRNGTLNIYSTDCEPFLILRYEGIFA